MDDTAAGGPASRSSDDGHSASESVKSDRDTEHAASLPTLTPLKEHVQKAFATFAKTVGATKKEIKKAGEIKMDTKTRAALEQIGIPASAENYVLAKKARKLMIAEAGRGQVRTDTVYWYMAMTYALDPIEWASFANPTPEDCAMVEATILREHGPP